MPFSTVLLKFVFKPEKLKLRPLTLGIVKSYLLLSPFLDFLSINGPAGYSKPITFPHLSKASPIESSKVSPINFISK